MDKKVKGIFDNLITVKQNIVSSVVIISISNIIIKVIGIINSSIIAKSFGTSKNLDVLLAIQSLVDFIIAVFTVTLSITFIPYYISLIKHRKKQTAQTLNNSLFSLLIVISVSLGFFLFFSSEAITGLLYGFKGVDQELAKNLLKISSISLVFFILSGQIINILNSQKNFLLPTIINIIISFFPALFILTLGDKIGVYSISLSILCGSFISFSFLLFALISNKISYHFEINIKEKNFRRVVKTSIFLFISACAVQINVLVDRSFGSRLPNGSISALNFARIIRDIPMIITASLSAIILPFLSEKAELKNKIPFSILINKSLNQGIYILIPATIGIFVIGDQIIDVLFTRGIFNNQSKIMTLTSLRYLLPGITFYWIITILTRVFYALKKFYIVIILGIFAIFFNIFADWYLIKYLSYAGIALATTLMEIIFFVIYLILTSIYVKSFKRTDFIIKFLKILSISLIVGILLFGLKTIELYFLPSILNEFKLIGLLVNISFGVLFYIFISSLIRLDEYLLFKIKIINPLFKKA